MKKIILSLLTIFMVLSLSVVLIKASESTTVLLEDGVQIRTDGNNGLKWVANVANHKEGNEYGFLFAQGDLAEVTIETNGVVNKVVEGVTDEELTMAATMVNFPKSAATQDISVVAYVKADDVYTYSNVVVRNLSEVAVQAYENGIATGDFVEAVYDASETTFNLNGGELCSQTMIITRYNNTTSSWGDMANITTKASGIETKNYNRVLLKFDSELNLYKVVGVIKAGEATTLDDDVDYDYRLQGHGTPSNAIEKASAAAIAALVGDPTATDYYLSFTLPSSSSNSCYIEVKYSKDVELLTSNKLHIGGGETLPLVQKDYYDFAGWYNNSELTGSAISKQGIDRNLYAKYTPTNYSINYELGDGNWVSGFTAPATYNYESAEIILPTKENIVIEEGTFIGWYDNAEGTGSAISSIPVNSNGNKVLYAIYQMNKPTEVELTDYEKSIIVKNNPTKYVSSNFANGKFDINGNVYVAGEGVLYTTLDAALAASSDDDVIYLFGESFTLGAAITKKVTILGPNADLAASAVRSTEAEITVTAGVTNVASAYIEFNGVKLRGSAASTSAGVYFQSKSSAKVFTIKSSVITRMNTVFKLQAGNGIVLTIENCNINDIGQFTVWVTAGMEKTSVISNIFDGSSCGGVPSQYAAQFRIRNGNFEAYDNQFLGDIKNNPGYFEVTGGGSGVVKYNTFKNISKFNYTGANNLITYDENLYLDAEGNVLDAAPANVSQASGIADNIVASSEQDRADRYTAFLNGEEFEEKIKFTAYLYENVLISKTTLPFHNGGYFSNLSSICYYNKANSAASAWQFAYKVGYSYDESLGAYVVKQLIASGTLLDDTNRTSEHYLIIHTENCPTGLAWAQGLSIGQVLSFSVLPENSSAVAGESTESVVSLYLDNYKKVTGVVCEESIELPALTAKGYRLVGWYDNAEFNGSPVTSYSAETDGEEVYFYAKWEKSYYGVAVKSTVEGYVTPETVSLSEDGLTVTFDGTPAYIAFQIYNGDEKMVMSPSKWTFTSSNSAAITHFSNYSCIAKLAGAGTTTLTFVNVADPSIVVDITITVKLAA